MLHKNTSVERSVIVHIKYLWDPLLAEQLNWAFAKEIGVLAERSLGTIGIYFDPHTTSSQRFATGHFVAMTFQLKVDGLYNDPKNEGLEQKMNI